MDKKILSLNKLCKIENAAVDGDVLRIGGYACHYDVTNLNSERVNAKSFDSFFCLYNEGKLKPRLNWEHTDTVIGGIDEIVSKENGLWINCHLNQGVKIVSDMIAPNILSGDLDSFSTEGYILNGYNGIVENAEDDSYYVKDFILTAVSIVRTPADWDAVFTVQNFIDEFKANKPRGMRVLPNMLY